VRRNCRPSRLNFSLSKIFLIVGRFASQSETIGARDPTFWGTGNLGVMALVISSVGSCSCLSENNVP